MKKTILAAVPLVVLALAAPAGAHGKHATTFRAKLAPTVDSTVRGKASLVDGKRRDKLQLRVKGLQAGATYTWSLRTAPAGGDACTGDAVASSSLAARRKGDGRLRARGKGFAAGTGAYAVVLTDAEGEDVACFELRSKAQRKADRKAAKKQQREASEDERGDDDDQGEDSDDDHGEDESDDSVEHESADDDDSDDELEG